MPLQMFARVPCSTFSQLCYVVMFLHRLTTAEGDAAWNAAAARRVLDPLRTVDRIIHTFEQVKAAAVTHAPCGGEDQALSLGIQKFHAFRSAWQTESVFRDDGSRAAQEAGAEMSDGSGSCAFLPGLYMVPNSRNGFVWN